MTDKTREAFEAWANERGNDTAFAYDTERSRWVFFNPMTADLWQAWSAATEAKDKEIKELRRLIADDAYAMTFQTFGQYRTALLKAIDAKEQQ